MVCKIRMSWLYISFLCKGVRNSSRGPHVSTYSSPRAKLSDNLG